jgi:hypothetical protein
MEYRMLEKDTRSTALLSSTTPRPSAVSVNCLGGGGWEGEAIVHWVEPPTTELYQKICSINT